MQDSIDSFGIAVHTARRRRGLTQKQLAEKLHMSTHTIMDIELGRSNPHFETVALIARKLDISLDAILFPDSVSAHVSISLVDYFSGKSESQIQKYVALCQQADRLTEER